MSDTLLLSLISAIIFLLFVVLWLWHRLQQLQSRLEDLERMVNRSNEDIAGLCSAAVTVDSRLLGADKQLRSIIEKLAQYQHQEEASTQHSSPSSYQNVIQKIRQGADADELVRDYGLSREEAVLLIRLNAAR